MCHPAATVRLDIAFVCPPSGYDAYPFNGHSIATGLGGSEAALVTVAEGLAQLGHRVGVYGAARDATRVDGVTYRPSAALPARADVVVVFRFEPDAVPDAAFTALWSTDLPTDDPPLAMHQTLALGWPVVALSDYHRARLVDFGRARGIDTLAARASVIPCPIRTADYHAPRTKRRNQFIFCSVPDRGLDRLLTMWPAIRRKLPDSTLVVTGGYGLWGHPERDRPPAPTPGMTWAGPVPRRDLVDRQLESEIHLHPTSWPENFCIASMECQAAGTPTIASSVGAMPTTVRDGVTGIVVPGATDGAGFAEAFVNAALDLAADRQRLAAMSSAARVRAHNEFAAKAIAERWDRFIAAGLESRSLP